MFAVNQTVSKYSAVENTNAKDDGPYVVALDPHVERDSFCLILFLL